jgi:hypothetical protein
LQALGQFKNAVAFFGHFLEIALSFAGHRVDLKTSAELVATSFCFIAVQLVQSVPSEQLKFMETNLFAKIFHSLIFHPKFYYWSSDPTNQLLRFAQSVRQGLFGFMFLCFQTESLAKVILDEVDVRLRNAVPQSITEIFAFLVKAQRKYSDIFFPLFHSSSLPKTLLDLNYNLLRLDLKTLTMPKSYSRSLGQIRGAVLSLYAQFYIVPMSRAWFFATESHVRLLFTLLLEPGARSIAFQLVAYGFQKHPEYNPLCRAIRDFMRLAREHKGKKKWINLVLAFLQFLPQPLSQNIDILKNLDDHDFLSECAQLIWMSTKSRHRIDIANWFFRCCKPIVTGRPYYRKRLKGVPLDTILAALAGQPFGDETVDLLLGLIFEQDISVSKLPPMAWISNQEILPFVHHVTRHLPVHSVIFGFLGKVCQPSMTNRLRVLRSKFLITVLTYFQEFDSDSDCPASIGVLFDIFTTVSSFLFKWNVFFQAISALLPISQPRKNFRSWRAGRLVDSFSRILRKIRSTSPISFFNFDGRSTGLSVPFDNDAQPIKSAMTLCAVWSWSRIPRRLPFSSLSLKATLLLNYRYRLTRTIIFA